MKLEDVNVPHTLGGVLYILSLYINSVKEVVSHLEVELYKPRRYISLVTLLFVPHDLSSTTTQLTDTRFVSVMGEYVFLK
jgi:hypothetical protein